MRKSISKKVEIYWVVLFFELCTKDLKNWLTDCFWLIKLKKEIPNNFRWICLNPFQQSWFIRLIILIHFTCISYLALLEENGSLERWYLHERHSENDMARARRNYHNSSSKSRLVRRRKGEHKITFSINWIRVRTNKKHALLTVRYHPRIKGWEPHSHEWSQLPFI